MVYEGVYVKAIITSSLISLDENKDHVLGEFMLGKPQAWSHTL